ncbi:hypothetical protein [Agromyces lapidis]|uniref:Uncharacterized protein n=1 Tax=Agromyces lapidis TaxID=279574 RepID=A0ABV5SP42_9MICO|nr:hypothetical protein [Agromyces lapidis]
MTEATCAVLSAVYPLVLITVVLEQRSIDLGIRRRRWFRAVTFTIVAGALVGLGLSVIGVQLHGLGPVAGVANWLVGLIAVGGLGFLLLSVLATLQAEEDAETDAEAG